MRIYPLIVCAALAVSCLPEDNYHPVETPEPGPEQTTPQEPANPQDQITLEKNSNGCYILKDQKVYNTGVEPSGLSSIILNQKGDGFYVAHDEGTLYEIGFDGTVKNTVPLDPVNDWEGLTIDRATGTIYICAERERKIYKADVATKKATLVLAGINEGSADNRGYEGLAYGDGKFFIANQEKPKRIYTYDVASGTLLGSVDLEFPAYLSDLCYDDRDGTLWLTDSKRQVLSNIKTDGTIIAQYDISFVQKPEGFCLDTAHNLFWFVCDNTNKLHSASYK